MLNITPKQQRFCEEYLVDCNATQAAIRCGYSPKTAYSQGQRLLKNVEVQKYLDEVLEKLKSENIADVDEVLTYLTSVLRGESASEVIATEFIGDGVSKIRKITKSPDEKERLKAAELLGKRYGAFTEKMEMNGVIPIVISGGEDLAD